MFSYVSIYLQKEILKLFMTYFNVVHVHLEGIA